MKKVKQSCCESCLYYEFDEEVGYNQCSIGYFDQDEMEKTLVSRYKGCPYYRIDNEYEIVNKQI